MLLSLCMIVKNEQENLPRCLESVKGIVDEMIVVDTGSTDDTVKIAEGYGAKVFHFPWTGSFSDARNHSLRQASGDWILLMDADDELEAPRRAEVRELARAGEADAYFFLTVSYLGDAPGLDVMNNLNVRLLKNGKGYFFSNPIHEQIYTNIKAVNPAAAILNSDIRVYHYGYLSANVLGQDKRNRNIALLQKELEENPGYGFALFNLGNEYYALGDNLKALEYYEKSYEKFDPPQGYSSKLVLKLANCRMNLGRYDDALAVLEDGLRHYPDFTDLVFLQALIAYARQRHTLALRLFERCLGMGEAPLHLSVIDGAGSYRAAYMRGEICYCLEDYEYACASYARSLDANTGFTPAAGRLISSFCRRNPGKRELQSFLDGLLKDSADERFFAAAEVLTAQGHYETALRFIRKRMREKGGFGRLAYERAMCELLLKNYESARKAAAKIKCDAEYAAKARCLESLCFMLEKDYARARESLTDKCTDAGDCEAQVYAMLAAILETGEHGVLSEDEKESERYTRVIFELLGVLIDLHEFETFEKALNLLNAVTDRTVLQRLALLYYQKGCYGLAHQELMRSIKTFDYLTEEGAAVLHKLKLRGLQ